MIAERLRLLRREQGMTKRGLVADLAINYSTYANYESGFREPNSEVLRNLARHFGVSLDYLLGVSDNRKRADEIAVLCEAEHDHIVNFRRLDIHGREMVTLVMDKELERVITTNAKPHVVKEKPPEGKWVVLQVFQQRASAGLGSYLSDEHGDDFETMRFMATPISQRADFCVKVKGESMEPRICDGDIVFVKAVPRVDIDNVGIFMYEGEAFCKRLRLDEKRNMIFLESLNKAYAPKYIHNPDHLRTVGLVIGIAEK